MSEARKILEAMRRKRGYLLDYHKLMGTSDPKLLETYDAFYSQLTLADKALTRVEKETVWIALIVATRAARSILHFDRAEKAGMSKDAISDAVGLAAACESIDAFGFSNRALSRWVDDARAQKRYLRAFEAARGRCRPWLSEVAAAVAHAGRRNPAGMALHLERAFKRGAKREQVAEALSYVLLHCGGPTMIDAVECWVETAQRKRIPAPF